MLLYPFSLSFLAYPLNPIPLFTELILLCGGVAPYHFFGQPRGERPTIWVACPPPHIASADVTHFSLSQRTRSVDTE